MAKNIVTKEGGALIERPDFLITPEGMNDGLAEVQKFMQVPRVKHVQNNAKSPFKELFKGGELAAVPLMQSITNGPADPKVPAYHFVPLHFFVEYITWNPYGTTGNAIRARSFEPTSEIAVKSRNSDTRKEPCMDFPLKDGKPQLIKHLEHMVWVVLILEPNPVAGIPIAMNFSSGEHKAGSAFSTLIGQRNPLGTPRDRKVPIFGMQFAAYVRERTNSQGSWFGTDVQNPATDSGVTPFVQDRERFQMYAETAKLLQAKHAENMLVVEMDDEQQEAVPAAESNKY